MYILQVKMYIFIIVLKTEEAFTTSGSSHSQFKEKRNKVQEQQLQELPNNYRIYWKKLQENTLELSNGVRRLYLLLLILRLYQATT